SHAGEAIYRNRLTVRLRVPRYVGVGRATDIEPTGLSVSIYCKPRHFPDGRACPFRRPRPVERGLGLATHVQRQINQQLAELDSEFRQVRKSKSNAPTALSTELAIGIGGLRRSTAEPSIRTNSDRNVHGICPNR